MRAARVAKLGARAGRFTKLASWTVEKPKDLKYVFDVPTKWAIFKTSSRRFDPIGGLVCG